MAPVQEIIAGFGDFKTDALAAALTTNQESRGNSREPRQEMIDNPGEYVPETKALETVLTLFKPHSEFSCSAFFTYGALNYLLPLSTPLEHTPLSWHPGGWNALPHPLTSVFGWSVGC